MNAVLPSLTTFSSEHSLFSFRLNLHFVFFLGSNWLSFPFVFLVLFHET